MSIQEQRECAVNAVRYSQLSEAKKAWEIRRINRITKVLEKKNAK